MKVKELLNQLSGMNPESVVFLQVDAEGNGYNELRIVDGNAFFVDGEVMDAEWSAEDCCLDEELWNRIKNNDTKCLVLSP